MDKQTVNLYFIMGTVNLAGRDPLHVLEEALKGGVTSFQLREKGPSALVGEELKAFALACQQLCEKYSVPFIVNDDIDLAIEIGADGIHIGQEDGYISVVRDKVGPDMLIGVSTHNVTEAIAAADAGADYIGLGPVYETQTKADTQPVIGIETISEVVSLLPGLPIVAVGGITEHRAGAVIKAGASGIAVISAISGEEDPGEAASRLKGAVLLSLTGIEM
ncbi:thiamine phosphate synthase [Sporosarcina sp. E16_8]|uniref:thiamine phosphate synthase n=1 Tax=Sporosarcina sp. E16_8 TaxID=2789295 RepID=UPI001A90DC1B|nr:thiamine phosphate synthase [Sporosarcina sp. E16_8]MBO0587231.1 thiamine phosphate synthase [Sporosarcina sp. E16_8]